MSVSIIIWFHSYDCNWIYAHDVEQSFIINLKTSLMKTIQIFSTLFKKISTNFFSQAEEEKVSEMSRIWKALKIDISSGNKWEGTESRETFIILWTHDFLPLAFYCKLTACLFFTDCMFFLS